MFYQADIVFGAVVILPDINRDDYVAYCLASQTVAIQLEDGGIFKNCPVVSSFLGANEGFINTLDFPSVPELLGSKIIALYIPENNTAIVIGCIRTGQSSLALEEKSFYLGRQSDTGSFTIQGRSLKGIIDLIATGDGAQINITAKNGKESGIIALKSDLFNLEANTAAITLRDALNLLVKNPTENTKTTSISYTNGKGFQYLDEFGNAISIIDGEMVLDAEKMYFGEKSKSAAHPMALGDVVEDLMGQLCEGLLEATVATALGPQPLLNSVTFAKIKAILKTLKSTTNFTK